MSKKLTKQQRNNVIRVSQLFFGSRHVRQQMAAAPVTTAQWPEADVELVRETLWNYAHREEAVVLKASADSQRSRAGWPACKFIYVSGGNAANEKAYCDAAAKDLLRQRVRVEEMSGYVVEAAKKDVVAVEVKRIEKMTVKQQARLRAALGW